MSAPALTKTPGGRDVRPPLVLTALLVAVASFQLNATMLAPAVTAMAKDLNTDTTTIGYSATLFTFVAALAGLLWPPLSDIIGRRRALLLSIGIMSIGSLISALALNVPMLMAGRALQGACGATFSLAFLLLRDLLDAKRFGKYLGITTAVNAGVGGVDTLLGGVMTDALGFRSIFGLTFVLEILALVLIARWSPESIANRNARMDWFGTGALAVALLGINLGLTSGFAPGGWTSMTTWLWFAIAVIALVVFRVAEGRVQQPLLSPAAMRDRGVWGTLLTTFFTMSSNFAVLVFLVPTFATDTNVGFGLSATMSAVLFLAPFSLLGWAAAPIVGTYAPRVGYRLLLRVGLAGSVALTLSMVVGFQSMWVLAALVFLMGLTYSALAATTLNGMGVIYSPEGHPGILPGLNSAMFNFGASVGIGMFAALLGGAKGTDGYHSAFVLAAVLAALAFIVSWALPARVREGEKV